MTQFYIYVPIFKAKFTFLFDFVNNSSKFWKGNAFNGIAKYDFNCAPHNQKRNIPPNTTDKCDIFLLKTLPLTFAFFSTNALQRVRQTSPRLLGVNMRGFSWVSKTRLFQVDIFFKYWLHKSLIFRICYNNSIFSKVWWHLPPSFTTIMGTITITQNKIIPIQAAVFKGFM